MKLQVFFPKNINMDGLYFDVLSKILTEDLIVIHTAQPGWRMCVFAVDETTEDIICDIIDVEKVGIFSGMNVLQKKQEKNSQANYLISKYANVNIPLIPENYNGILKDFVLELEKLPNWNRIYPMSLTFGLITPNDKRSNNEIIEDCKASYKIELESIQKALNPVMDKLLEILNPQDKSKLN